MSKTIHAASAFSVNLVRDKVGLVTVKVPEGVSIQEDDVAEHWFTKAHLASGGLGSAAYAETVRAQADSAFVKARDAIKHYESLEAAAQEAEAAAGIEDVEPAWKRLSATAEAEAEDEAEGEGEGEGEGEAGEGEGAEHSEAEAESEKAEEEQAGEEKDPAAQEAEAKEDAPAVEEPPAAEEAQAPRPRKKPAHKS